MEALKNYQPTAVLVDSDEKAALEYENSTEAIDCFRATMEAKGIIKSYWLNGITLNRMREQLTEVKNKLPIDYQPAFRQWYNAYFATYTVKMGLSLAFLLKASGKKLYSALSYKLPITFGDEEDTFGFYQAITRRLIKATSAIVNEPINHNNLFGEAEVNAMRRRQEMQIDAIREAGGNLVLVSSHADCSSLCQPYQGRLYSLDGTSGISSDGRSYTPLEDAVGSTKLMHRYCKHTFLAYKPHVAAPVYTKAEMEREAVITSTQREMERKCRYLYDRWETYDKIDNAKAASYATKYNDAVDNYIKWCGENGREAWLNRI